MKPIMIFLLFVPILCFSQRGAVAESPSEDLTGETYALVIGISKYEKFNSLNFADADAIAFANYLKDSTGMNLPACNVRLLINDQAKNGDILENGMVWLEQSCKKGSRAIIYFAGHGVSVGNNNAYLMAYNVSPQFNKANIFYSGGVPLFNIKRDFIAPMHEKGVEVILIIDACRSFDAVNGKDGLTLLSQSTLDDNTGEIRILSSSNSQQSFEDVPGKIAWYGHGVFTYYLLQGLYGKADIINKDGRVSLNEIKRYLQINVPEATGFKQEPSFCCDQNLQATIGTFTKSYVESDFLRQIASNKTQLLAVNSTGRGIIKTVVIPDEVKPVVDSFYYNLNKKRFFGSYLADYYFNKIQKLDSIYQAVKDEVLLNYCGTLSNEVQLAIGEYLEGDIATAQSQVEGSGVNTNNGPSEYHDIKKKFLQWEDIFASAARSAQRLYELRLKYYPGHPYNEVAEMRYYFCKSRSFYNKTNDSVLVYINKALRLDSNQAYLYHVATLVSEGAVALAYNDKCLELYPDFKYALNSRGLILKGMKRYQEAEQTFYKCLSIDSLNPDPLNNLGTVFVAEKRYPEAEVLFKKAISLDPNYRVAYRNLGDIYAFKKQNKEAEQMYLKSISVDSTFAWSWLHLGDFYKNLKRFPEAEQSYKKAISTDSLYKDAYNFLGNFYLNQERYKESERTYLEGLQIDSNYKYFYGNLGNLNIILKRYLVAEKMLRKALRKDSVYPYAYFSLGRLYREQNQFKEAEKNYLIAMSLDSLYKSPYYYLGSLYRKQSRYQEAEEIYLRCLHIDSTDAVSYFNLALLYKDMGRTQDVIAMYLQAIRIDSLYVDAYNNLGGAYYTLSRYKEAEAVLLKALSIDSNYLFSLVKLGDVYRQQNFIDKALQQYKKGIRINPGFKSCYSAIGRIYLNRKEYQDAMHYYGELLKIDSLDATGLSNRIIAFIYMQDTTNALIYFNKEFSRELLGYFEYYQIGLAFKETGDLPNTEKALVKSYALKPDYPYTLSNLCIFYIRNGYTSELYEPLISGLKNFKDDKFAAYNLACIFALLKNKDEFMTYFQKSLELGYNNWDNIAKDTDLDNFREAEKFKELVTKYKN